MSDRRRMIQQPGNIFTPPNARAETQDNLPPCPFSPSAQASSMQPGVNYESIQQTGTAFRPLIFTPPSAPGGHSLNMNQQVSPSRPISPNRFPQGTPQNYRATANQPRNIFSPPQRNEGYVRSHSPRGVPPRFGEGNGEMGIRSTPFSPFPPEDTRMAANDYGAHRRRPVEQPGNIFGPPPGESVSPACPSRSSPVTGVSRRPVSPPPPEGISRITGNDYGAHRRRPVEQPGNIFGPPPGESVSPACPSRSSPVTGVSRRPVSPPPPEGISRITANDYGAHRRRHVEQPGNIFGPPPGECVSPTGPSRYSPRAASPVAPKECESAELRQQVELVQKQIEMTKEAIIASEQMTKEQIKATEEANAQKTVEMESMLTEVERLNSQVEKLQEEVREKGAELVTLHTSSEIESENMKVEIEELKGVTHQEKLERLRVAPALEEVNHQLQGSPKAVTELAEEQHELVREIESLLGGAEADDDGGFIPGTDMMNFELSSDFIEFEPTPDFIEMSPPVPPLIKLSPKTPTATVGRQLDFVSPSRPARDTPSPPPSVPLYSSTPLTPPRPENYYEQMLLNEKRLMRPPTPPQLPNYDVQQWCQRRLPPRRPQGAGPEEIPIKAKGTYELAGPEEMPIRARGNYDLTGTGEDASEGNCQRQPVASPPIRGATSFGSPGRQSPSARAISPYASPPIQAGTGQYIPTSSPPIPTTKGCYDLGGMEDFAFSQPPSPNPTFSPGGGRINPNVSSPSTASPIRPPSRPSSRPSSRPPTPVGTPTSNMGYSSPLSPVGGGNNFGARSSPAETPRRFPNYNLSESPAWRPPTPPPLPNYNPSQWYTGNQVRLRQNRKHKPQIPSPTNSFNMSEEQSGRNGILDMSGNSFRFVEMPEYDSPGLMQFPPPTPPPVQPWNGPRSIGFVSNNEPGSDSPLAPPPTPSCCQRPPNRDRGRKYTPEELSACPVGPSVDGFCPCTQMATQRMATPRSREGILGESPFSRTLEDSLRGSTAESNYLITPPGVGLRNQSPLGGDFTDMSFTPMSRSRSPSPRRSPDALFPGINEESFNYSGDASFSPIRNRPQERGIGEESGCEMMNADMNLTPRSRNRSPSPMRSPEALFQGINEESFNYAGNLSFSPIQNVRRQERGIGEESPNNFSEMSFTPNVAQSPSWRPEWMGLDGGILEEEFFSHDPEMSFSPIQAKRGEGLRDVEWTGSYFEETSFSPFKTSTPVESPANVVCRGGLMDQSSLAVLPNQSFSPPVNRRPVEEYEKNLTQSTGIGDISLNEFGLSRDISWHTPPPQTMSPFSNRNISGRYTGGDMIEFPFDAPAMIDISDDLMQFSPPRGPSFPPGRNIPFCELKGRDYNLPPSPPLPGNSNGSPYGVSPKAAYRLSPGYIQPPGSDPTKPVIKMDYVGTGINWSGFQPPSFQDMSFSPGESFEFDTNEMIRFAYGNGIEQCSNMNLSNASTINFNPNHASTPIRQNDVDQMVGGIWDQSIGSGILQNDLSFSPVKNTVPPRFYISGNSELRNVSPIPFQEMSLNSVTQNTSFGTPLQCSTPQDERGSRPVVRINTTPPPSANVSASSNYVRQSSERRARSATPRLAEVTPFSFQDMSFSPIENNKSNRMLSQNLSPPEFDISYPGINEESYNFASSNASFSPIRAVNSPGGIHNIAIPNMSNVSLPFSPSPVRRERRIFNPNPAALLDDTFNSIADAEGKSGEWVNYNFSPAGLREVSFANPLEEVSMDAPLLSLSLAGQNQSQQQQQQHSPSSLLSENSLAWDPYQNQMDFSFDYSTNSPAMNSPVRSGIADISGSGINAESGFSFRDMSFTPVGRDGSGISTQNGLSCRNMSFTPVKREGDWSYEDSLLNEGIQETGNESFNMSLVSEGNQSVRNQSDGPWLMGTETPPPIQRRPWSASARPIPGPRDLRTDLIPSHVLENYALNQSPTGLGFGARQNETTPPRGSPQLMEFSPIFGTPSPSRMNGRPMTAPPNPVDLRTELPLFEPTNPNLIHFGSPDGSNGNNPIGLSTPTLNDLRSTLYHYPERVFEFANPTPAPWDSPVAGQGFDIYNTPKTPTSPNLMAFSPDRSELIQFSPVPDLIAFSPNSPTSPNYSCPRTR